MHQNLKHSQLFGTYLSLLENFYGTVYFTNWNYQSVCTIHSLSRQQFDMALGWNHRQITPRPMELRPDPWSPIANVVVFVVPVAVPAVVFVVVVAAAAACVYFVRLQTREIVDVVHNHASYIPDRCRLMRMFQNLCAKKLYRQRDASQTDHLFSKVCGRYRPICTITFFYIYASSFKSLNVYRSRLCNICG